MHYRFSGKSIDILENPQMQFGGLWMFQKIHGGNAMHCGFSRKSMDVLDNAQMQFGYPAVPERIF